MNKKATNPGMVAWCLRCPVAHVRDSNENSYLTISIRPVIPLHAALRVSVQAGMLGGSPEASPIHAPCCALTPSSSWQSYPDAIVFLRLMLIQAGFSVWSTSIISSSRSASAAESVRRAITVTASRACPRSTDCHLADKCGVAVSPRVVGLYLSQSVMELAPTGRVPTGQRSLGPLLGSSPTSCVDRRYHAVRTTLSGTISDMVFVRLLPNSLLNQELRVAVRLKSASLY